MADHSATTVYGRDVADRLAALAIDMSLNTYTAASPIRTYSTQVPAHYVEQVRDVLTDAGFDARAFHREKKASAR